MLITYFDEVKYQAGRQEFYWLAGISVRPEHIRQLEHEVNALAAECFGSGILSKQTELHASAIFGRGGNFKAWRDTPKRMDVLKRLLKIADRPNQILKTYVRLDPAKMIAAGDLGEKAFMFFVERVDQLAAAHQTHGLLIGDLEAAATAAKSAERLSAFRTHGTPYHFGQELQAVIDTVHFTPSHLSRMLQLADAYAWANQCVHQSDTAKYPRSEICNFISEETELLSPNKYKIWPTANAWVQKA